MRRKIWMALVLMLALTVLTAGALAADVFKFEKGTVSVFEGETLALPLIREGSGAEDAPVTWTVVEGKKALSVDENGTVTGLNKGQATVRASMQGSNRKFNANITVNVIRKVTAVTLNTTRLNIFAPTDARISGLLQEETSRDVIVVPAGKSINLNATCTPQDANNRKIVYTSSDTGVFRISDNTGRGMQAGECELTVSSYQNPEVSQTFKILVTQPVTKITVNAPEGKTVNVGGTTLLAEVVEPANASIPAVEWSSRNTGIATVDEEGRVTGVKRGTVVIDVKATDGSGKASTVTITVEQQATSVTIREDSLNVAAGLQGTLHATVLPENANNRGVTWSSTDESIATVNASGQVKGIRRGECSIIATSKSNPEIHTSIQVRVIQRVTNIVFSSDRVSLPIRTQTQLSWTVLPADASITDVTFTSSNRNVATVDSNGLVTGLTKGTATITATATDGSGKRGTVRVTVTQPVEGVSIQYQVYHVQTGRTMNVKAIVSPNNASNKNVHFTTGNDYVATVTDNGNIGRVRGRGEGTTTITGVTEDGGFSASAELRVADFNRAIVVDDLYIEGEKIRIVLRNRSNFSVDRVYFTVETYDGEGKPLVCNADGVSNTFEGAYRLEIGPDERSQHYKFDFGHYVQPLSSIGTVVLKVTSWRDLEGYTRTIPESEQPTQSFTRFVPGGSGSGSGGQG